jgi:lysophospholipase L1-like esterase
MLQTAYPAPSGTTEAAVQALTAAASTAGGVQLYNGAVSGLTSSNYATTTLINQAVALAPRVIMHWVGSNDYAANVDPAVYKANLKAAIDAIDAALTAPHVHLLIQGHERFDVTNRTYSWAQYNQAQQDLAASQSAGNVFNVDLSAAFSVLGIPPSTRYGTDTLALMNADKIHLLDAGHALLAETLRVQLDIPATPQPALVLSDTTAPTVPGTPTATAGTTSATLTNFATSTDANAPITYLIYSSADSYANSIGTTTGSSYTASSLPAGTAVSFKVAARDPSGNTSALSAASNSVIPTASSGADTTPPGTSTLTAKPKAASVLLSWTAATDDIGVTNYRVYRDGTQVTRTGNVLTYTDGSLTNGQRYSYTVAAEDAAGNIGTQSAAVLVVPGAIVDNFDSGTNGANLGTTETGQTWSAPLTHGIQYDGTGGAKRTYATDTSASTGRGLSIFPVTTGVGTLAVKVKTAPSAAGVAGAGVVLRSTTDGSNFWYWSFRNSATVMNYNLYRITAVAGGPGSQGAATNTTTTPQSGDLLEFKMIADGTITVYLNGVQLVASASGLMNNSSGASQLNMGLYDSGNGDEVYEWISWTAA